MDRPAVDDETFFSIKKGEPHRGKVASVVPTMVASVVNKKCQARRRSEQRSKKSRSGSLSFSPSSPLMIFF
jgi:hypothetical protein